MLGFRVRGSPCIDAYEAWTNIYLVYVRIPQGDHHASTSIHLVYFRVPGKGIAKHQRLRGDDDTGEIGIDNELGRNSCG
jgi:hypothetical protein